MEGKRLAHYEILDKLGEGGMGVVWRARDTTLDREVAIKLLPELFARDTERLARFEREARLLASLNHPGIAAIHGLHEEPDGTRFLAMELVPGENLADRLARGALPIDEALFVAIQVAEALEAAHAQGVIHRDLKPANIILTPEGKAKVLDFGLAKSAEPDAPSGSDLSASPTVTSLGTVAGVILGTAAYMSPEQARGKRLDRRTDIWSFGCVLFEMLSAHRLFGGESVSDSLGAILHKEPDWSRLPSDTPPMVRWLLRRCLTRNPQKRLHDIADARVELQHALEDPQATGIGLGAASGDSAATRSWLLPLVAAATLVVGLAAGGALFKEEPEPLPLRKLDLGVVLDPEGGGVPSVALSPDGKHAAFTYDGRLWVQPLDALASHEIPGTEGAREPFWSPDGTQIAYFVGSVLWKTSIAGGAVVLGDLGSESTPGTGGAWAPDGTIYAALGTTGILQMPASGGDPKMAIPPADGEGDLHQPHVLPGGRGVLFVSHPLTAPPGVLDVWSGGERKQVLALEGQAIWNPCYSPSGHILFERTGGGATEGIWALPFSLETLAATGEPFLVLADAGRPSVAGDGSLLFAHRPGAGRGSQLHWVDPEGVSIEPIGGKRPTAVWSPALSPDGERLAFVAGEGGQVGGQLWVRDLDRDTEALLAGDDGSIKFRVDWTEDGETIVVGDFNLDISDVNVLSVPADGSAPARVISQNAALCVVAPGGEEVLVVKPPEGERMSPAPELNLNLWRVPLDGSSEGELILDDPDRIFAAAVSADGRWLVYLTESRGRKTAHLTRYPQMTGRWQVASGDIEYPFWSPDGDRIYFTEGSTLNEVEVDLSGDVPRLGRVAALFDITRVPGAPPDPSITIAPDGTRFVAVGPAIEAEEADTWRTSIKFVQNWFAEFGVRSNP